MGGWGWNAASSPVSVPVKTHGVVGRERVFRLQIQLPSKDQRRDAASYPLSEVRKLARKEEAGSGRERVKEHACG